MCTLCADSEYVFGRGIEADDEQGLIEQYDACTQAVENLQGVPIKDATAGTLRSTTAGFF